MINRMYVIILLSVLPLTACGSAQGGEKTEAPEVYFIREITPRNMVRIYEAQERPATGKVAVKLSTGKTKNAAEMWSDLPAQDDFLESMAESAKSVADHCGDRILYISVMNNLSVDCDCDAHPEEPKMGDIGILASLDPVALDKACVDMVYASPDPGKSHLIERMESRHGIHTLEHAEAIGLGSQQYRLVELK